MKSVCVLVMRWDFESVIASGFDSVMKKDDEMVRM